MPTIPKILICAYENCSAKFKHIEKFNCHQRIHTGERPYVCQFGDCNKNYRRQSHLKRHEETHESNFRCTVADCSEVLKTKACLRKHLNFVHNKTPKTYKCSLCDKEFNKHNWLQRHMFRHTGQAPHVCPVEDCKKAFLLPSRLKRHMVYHKGYPCDKPDCNEVFPKWSLLVKHKKKAHPTIYECDTCHKRFTWWSNLKQHKLVHQEEREVFACDVPNCSRFYTLKRNLVHHVKYYHNKRPFVCPKENCPKAFKTQELLDNHVLRHDSKRPRRKKKKPKPTLAEKLSGCAPPKVINRKPVSNSESNDSPLPKEVEVKEVLETEQKSDFVTVYVTLNSDDEPVCSDISDSKSCLAIFEDIMNNNYVASNENT